MSKPNIVKLTKTDKNGTHIWINLDQVQWMYQDDDQPTVIVFAGGADDFIHVIESPPDIMKIMEHRYQYRPSTDNKGIPL